MSTIERNKGLLELISKQEILSKFPNIDFDDIEWDSDGAYMEMSGNYYFVSYDVKEEEDTPFFADVEVLEGGKIKFHTMHYNGSNSLSDVIENAINKGEE